MSADLAVHKGLRARLVATPAVTALVPAGSILDSNSTSIPDPCIILGEGQTLEGDDIARKQQIVVMDLHIWKKEPSLAGVKTIAGLVRATIHSTRFMPLNGYHFGDCRVSHMRYLRDPDGVTSHAVVTVEALVSEV